VLTNGVIDLLFRSADEWQIRDYKTDLASTPDAYRHQLEAYRLALRAIGCNVSDAELVHVRSDRPLQK
jgi:ATP-dependent exoDNAse (exonuclease V) beta subunit